MLPNCELVNSFGNQYLVFKGIDYISNALKNGGWEIEVFALAQQILQKHQDGVVLDVGANLGAFTVPLAKANPHLTFHSFELQRIIYYQLCANTFINGLDNVHCHNFGLSDKQARITLQVPDYNTEANAGAFSIDKQVQETPGYDCLTKGKTETMTLFPLDAGNHKNVRLIKIDVEGHELEVLKGAKKTLKENNYPPVIFEAWDWKPWYQERRTTLFNYLKDLGYVITKGKESNNLAQHPDHGEMLK